MNPEPPQKSISDTQPNVGQETLDAMTRFTDELRRFNDRHKPGWRTTFCNLGDGIIRGLGFVLGTTLLFGLLLGLLSRLVTIPVVGKYVAEVVQIVEDEMKRR